MRRLRPLYIPFVLLSHTLFAQLSFAPADTLAYNSAGHFSTYHVGNVYAIDFNSDGLDDLLYLKGNLISVRLNTGTKSFGEETIVFQHAKHIYSVSNFADINKDGKLDMAIADDTYITTLYGGISSFTKANQIGNSVYYGKIILFDYNKDGKIDLTYSDNSNIYLFTDVESSLTNKNSIYTDVDGQIFSYEFKDLNVDNAWDLVVHNISKKLKILFGSNNNKFNSVFSKTVANLVYFEVGDLNLDGYQDIVYLEYNNNLFTLIYNNTSANYSEQAIFAGSLPGNLNQFKLIDLKNNGTLDLAFNNFFSLTVKENNGLGQFITQASICENDIIPYDFVVLDLTNDGYPDLLESNTNAFQIAEFNSGGSSSVKISEGYLDEYWDSFHVDLDLDTFEDIVSVSRTGSVTIRWGNSSHNYAIPVKYSIPLNALYGGVADVDLDGNLDILFTIQSPTNSVSNLMILKGLSNRLFAQPQDWRWGASNSCAPLIRDVTNDGKMDYVFYDFYGTIYWLDIENNNLLEVYTTNRKLTVTGNGLVGLTYGDINKDGFTDLLTANSTSKNISLLTNNQAGSFSESILTPNGSVLDVLGVKSFDYNDDLFDDLLVIVKLTESNFSLQVFLNNQTGALVYSTSLTLSDMFYPQRIHVLDLDDDQRLDFIVSNYDYGSANVFMNENTGFVNLGNSSIQSVGQASRVYYDFNEDHKPDVFTATFFSGDCFIQLNNSVEEPSQVESLITIDQVTTKSVKVSFSATNASGRFIVVTKGNESPVAPTDNHFYTSNLQFGVGSSLGNSSYVVYAGTKNSLEIFGLSSSTLYNISVFEYNSNYPQFTIVNYTSTKEVASFTTLNGPPKISSINDQFGTNLAKLSIPLVVSDDDNLLSELIYSFASSNTNVVPIANISVESASTNPTLKIQPVDAGEAMIGVTVKDPANNEATATFRYLSIVVGIGKSNVPTLQIFPNPFNNEVRVIGLDQSNASITIYDSQGFIVRHIDVTPDVLNLSELANGLYLIRASNGKLVKAIKY